MTSEKVALSGWGRHPWIDAQLSSPEDLETGSTTAVLSRGLGRAYGDAALPRYAETGTVLHTPRADRLLAFDETTGVLRAEAGTSLGQLRSTFLSRGWFPPVVPGTRHVTLGGMVAADIHGKNHHVSGSFGNHVRAIKLRVGDGRVLECTRQQHPELFAATLGGMGLTGHILEVEFTMERVPSPWIYEESERFDTLEEVFAALRAASEQWPMTVAWIDTSSPGPKMGRGIVMRGRWATPDEAPKHPPPDKPSVRIPFDFPNGLVNPFTIGILNRLWFWKHGAKARKHIVHPESFFWVLDSVGQWNRVFGRRGFTQYQCVLPSSAEVFRGFLTLFQQWRACSFVTVLKDCGPQGEGLISFPQTGSTIAVDIPLRDPELARQMTAAFNDYVLAHGGRIYLAKDAFTSAEHFERMYPRLQEWREVCHRYDPQGNIRSAMSQRLLPPVTSKRTLEPTVSTRPVEPRALSVNVE